MERIINSDGNFRMQLMECAEQLLKICIETGNPNIQLSATPWEKGNGIKLLATSDGKPVLVMQVDTSEN